MKKAALIPGQDYMTYRGDNPADAYDAHRVRLLTTRGVDMSTNSNAPGLDMEIEGDIVHVPVAKAPKGAGTHLVFEKVDPKTGQPEGKYAILTPSQIKHPWDEGLAVVTKAREDISADRDARIKASEAREALAESLTSRVGNLLPGNVAAIKASPYDDTGVIINAEDLSAIVDLAQRAKFGPV